MFESGFAGAPPPILPDASLTISRSELKNSYAPTSMDLHLHYDHVTGLEFLCIDIHFVFDMLAIRQHILVHGIVLILLAIDEHLDAVKIPRNPVYR